MSIFAGVNQGKSVCKACKCVRVVLFSIFADEF